MDEALPILLCHPLLHTPQLLCKLLATSKQLAALVHECCAGILTVAWDVDKPPAGEAAWASKHALLLGELRLEGHCSGPAAQAKRSAIEAGLAAGAAAAAAAAAADGLQLRALHSIPVHMRTLALLPASLTELDLWNGVIADEPAGNGEAELAAALSRGAWPQLRQLQLPRGALQCSDSTPALVQLTGLSSLRTRPPISSSTQDTRLLPATLERLELMCYGEHQPLFLGHLSALSALELGRRAVTDADTLPASSLVELTTYIRQGTPVEPLLALSHLTRLGLDVCTVPAEQLLRLTSLQQLSHLRLDFEDDEGSTFDLAEASAALGALPLQELHAYEEHIPAATLLHLRACTRLTSLTLVACEFEASMEQLAAVLSRLPGLQELRLSSPNTHGDAGGGGVAASAAASAAASGEVVGGGATPAWPQLQRCDLSYMNWQQLQPLAPLLAAPHLTALWLGRMHGDDDVVRIICGCGSGLRKLELSWCAQLDDCARVTDVALAAVAAGLRQLTHLTLEYLPAITDAGVKRLSCLRHLRELVVSVSRCLLPPSARRWGSHGDRASVLFIHAELSHAR